MGQFYLFWVSQRRVAHAYVLGLVVTTTWSNSYTPYGTHNNSVESEIGA